MFIKCLLALILTVTSWVILAQEPKYYVEYIPFQMDVLSIIDGQSSALLTYKELHAKKSSKTPLSGLELNLIHETVVNRTEMISRISKYLLSNSLNKKLRYKYQKKEENISLGNEKTREVLRSLGLSMVLADNFLQSTYYYYNDDNLRRIVDEPHSVIGKKGKLLTKAMKALLSKKNLKDTAYLIYFYQTLEDTIQQLASVDTESRFWVSIIQNSYSYNQLKKINATPSPKESYKQIRLLFKNYKHHSDLLYNTGNSVVKILSQIFGNTMGIFQWRHGYLRNRFDVINDLKSTLKPLDILLERAPFRLTDVFIPGYFGHNAIWLGTEEELKELDVWDHPAFIPLHKRIKQGKSIIEALRPGVTTNRIRHFLEIDDLAVIRIKNMSIDEKRRSLILAASQYNKKYDFNFNVETQNVLVCSELIFMSFVQFPWRTNPVMGRSTIRPDAVAERALPGFEFEPILLYTHGKKITGHLGKKLGHILANTKKSDRELLKDFDEIFDRRAIQNDTLSY